MQELKIGKNSVRLVGKLISGLEVSHRIEDKQFYKCTLKVERKSGICDIIPLIIKDEAVEHLHSVLKEGVRVLVEGSVRTLDEQREDGRRHLKVYVKVLYIIVVDKSVPDQNEVTLAGYLCKIPKYRITPLNREITELILKNYVSDKIIPAYIPCIAWNRTARETACLKKGEQVSIKGRFQSREYFKELSDDKVEARTAYEISIFTLA